MSVQSTEFVIPAKVEFIKGSSSGKARPRVHLLAYTGSPLRLPNYDFPVVIDMASATFAKDRLPIVADHSYGIESIKLGYTTSQNVGDVISAEGVITSIQPEAQQLVLDALDGIPFEVSVGAHPGHVYEVPEGRSVSVNGRTYAGPVLVAEDTVIREFSIVLLGADNQTAARIAASFRGAVKMTYAEWVKSIGLDPAQVSAEQDTTLKASWDETQKLDHDNKKLVRDNTKLEGDIAAAQTKPTKKPDATGDIQAKADEILASAGQKATDAIVAAETKAQAIKATFDKYTDVESVDVDGKAIAASQYKIDAIKAGADPRDIELTLLRASRAPTGFNINTLPAGGKPEIRGQAISASICAQNGVPMSHTRQDGTKVGLESMYSEEVLEASQSRDLRSFSLHQLMDQVITASGGHFNGNRRSNEFIEATFRAEQQLKIQGDGGVSTLGVTSILEDAANKNLLSAYQMQNVVWPSITQTRTLNDFKTHKYYRLTIEGGYSMVAPDGQIGHGRQSDQKYTIDPNTYGMIVALTRTDIINDDLDAFMQIPAGLGRLAATALEIAVVRTVLDADWGGAWLDRVSTSSPLSIDGLTKVDTAFMDSMDDDNKPVMVSPDRLLVPSALKFKANELYRVDTLLAQNTTAGDARDVAQNLHAGSFIPHATQILSNTNLTDMDQQAISANQSATDWYMFANPASIAAFQVGFVNGQQTPVIESGQLSFDRLGIQWRSYHDWGVGLGDPRGVIQAQA